MNNTSPSNEEPPASRRLVTVRQFCQQHTAFSVGGIRWLLFHRNQNGLERAVRKVGRRVLIDIDQFFLWIEGQNER